MLANRVLGLEDLRLEAELTVGKVAYALEIP
jgi:hypothetical protein